ncbi:unnamed protein product [Rotaria magnacalcarata]|uniref:Uncharacterized protein n=1 Tax=Rotaria magnacalcarata TaxID=392030 RepID=A0A816UT14_9BILA|nr:unnamed protein product [Rotaria magnacalcarata]CAF2111501.1 unnamed protein product [Rotaria magnacalcarata]CAF4120918.1 unnamed protein product [Rotaria magnacalcarata]CAF4126204.1 unnamed protein product [Rotaria magnacalcarata]CAF4292732.1 unnamed protein product [Rotaria magnacalcarata]
MNECEDDEYRCTNGQCIPQSFVQDDSNTPDCVDGSDEFRMTSTASTNCEKRIPSSECEDRIRQYTLLTNSCVQERKNLLWEAFYSDLSRYVRHYIPYVPLLFGHIYFVHAKNDSIFLAYDVIEAPFLCYRDPHYDEYFSHRSKFIFDNRTCSRLQTSPAPFILVTSWELKYHLPLYLFYLQLKGYHLVTNYTAATCNRSNTYRYVNATKCIPVNCLMDNNTVSQSERYH